MLLICNSFIENQDKKIAWKQPVWLSGFHAYASNKLLHAAIHGVSLTYSWCITQ